MKEGSKFNSRLLFCVTAIIIVFIFFAHTLNYPWKYFDEQIIYQETVLPIPRTFGEIFEYLKYFGLYSFFETSNPFYSSISNIRCAYLHNLITLFVSYLFQKNVFSYHLMSLILHLINTGILFLLLTNIETGSPRPLGLKTKDGLTPSVQSQIISMLLTLIWALHPANVETILFTTNWSALLTYSLCLIFIYYFLSIEKNSLLSFLTSFIFFIFTLFTREYPIVIPIILFFYIFATFHFNNLNSTFKESFIFTINKCAPLFLALICFICFFLLSPTKENLQNTSSIFATLERIFWLAPQIFFHFMKLIIFPFHLTIDQTTLINLGKELCDPYAIFCLAIVCLLIVALIVCFFKVKKHICYLFFVGVLPFLIALIPFLQILSPTYCMVAERYIYFPLFMLIFGGSRFVFYIFSNKNKSGIKCYAFTFIILVFILCVFSTKTYLRTFDWQDSISLFSSSLKEAPNELIKGLRENTLGSIYSLNPNTSSIGNEYINKAINTLNASLQNLEIKKNKNHKLPEIIKMYGLDPKTIQAKTAYLLAIITLPINKDFKKAYLILKPYMEDSSIIDIQILDFYLGILFATKRLDEAERLLTYAAKKKTSPVLFVILSELEKIKYNNLTKAEMYLKKSLKYFPYDSNTLLYIKELYKITGDEERYAYYSYLYNLRNHTLQ